MKLPRLSRLFRLTESILTLTAIASISQSALAGSIERLIYYDGLAGGSGSATTVDVLTNSVKFPNSPDYESELDDFSPPLYGFQSKNDAFFAGFNPGSYARGYLEAPASGNYTFFIASVNASQLSLSTNESAAGLQRIAYEPNSGAPLFYGPRLNTRQSAPISLIRGKKYYLEVLHQSSTPSSSFVQVGWQRPDGVQEIIPALHLAKYPNDPLQGSWTAPQFNIYPPGFYGNLGDLPSTLATNEGASLNLQVDVIAVQPTTFQWYRNGTLVPGENLSYLQFSPVHAVDNGAVFQVVITNVYGALTSTPVTFSITPDTTQPVITSVNAGGNPNGVIVTYSKPVSPATATNLANYMLQLQGGSTLVVTQATLLASQQSVQLTGALNLIAGVNYQLTVSGIVDQDTTPNALAPNPTVSVFTYTPSPGITYTFNDGTTNGSILFGSAVLAASGSYDGSGYVDLTDAAQFQRGVIQFTNISTVDQFHLKFKTRIGDASATPGDGFSINLAGDFPAGTFLNEQKGWPPLTLPAANRLVVAFDNDRTVSGVLSPAIVVKWQGGIVTNVPTGTGGIPPINSADGHWANVDLQLKRGGGLSLTFDGVVVFTNLFTGFVPVPNAQLEIAAQTGTNYETHWVDDVNINYADGDIGPVGFVTNPSLTNITVNENGTANFAVIPSGASPFYYQWYYNGSAVAGGTNSVLSVVGTLTAAGNYSVVVSNWFSVTNSTTASLSVTPDTTPPHLVSAVGLASGINEVLLTFSEPVDLFTGTNAATYSLGLLPLNSASLSADGLTVTLSTGTLERNQVYLFSINGLKDRSVAGNPLTTSASFATTVNNYASLVGLDTAVRYWRFNEPPYSSSVASIVTGQDALSLGFGNVEWPDGRGRTQSADAGRAESCSKPAERPGHFIHRLPTSIYRRAQWF